MTPECSRHKTRALSAVNYASLSPLLSKFLPILLLFTVIRIYLLFSGRCWITTCIIKYAYKVQCFVWDKWETNETNHIKYAVSPPPPKKLVNTKWKHYWNFPLRWNPRFHHFSRIWMDLCYPFHTSRQIIFQFNRKISQFF